MLTVPSFIKLLSTKYCLTKLFAKQTLSWAPVTTMIVILAGNLFLLSNTILCLPSFCAYRFYEIEPRQLFSHKHKHEKFSKVLLQFGNLTKETLLSD